MKKQHRRAITAHLTMDRDSIDFYTMLLKSLKHGHPQVFATASKIRAQQRIPL